MLSTKFFYRRVSTMEKDIIKANNLGNLLNSSDDSMSSADMVDQARLIRTNLLR